MHRSIKTKDSIHPPTPNSDVNPLSIDVLTKNGEVNTTELHALQTELIQATPLRYFTPHRQQYFHVDTGANVHATTDKADFLIFYRHKRSINIAAGQIAQSEGYGVVMVQLIPNRPPLPLAPVYYCPRASTGTLSPQCLKLYNNCTKPTHHLFESLSFICPHENKEIRLQTTKHNNLDFLHLSTMHFSTSMRTNPTIATLYTNGLNNQLAHQRFDHRSMEHIESYQNKTSQNYPLKTSTQERRHSMHGLCILEQMFYQGIHVPSFRNMHDDTILICIPHTKQKTTSCNNFMVD